MLWQISQSLGDGYSGPPPLLCVHAKTSSEAPAVAGLASIIRSSDERFTHALPVICLVVHFIDS